MTCATMRKIAEREIEEALVRYAATNDGDLEAALAWSDALALFTEASAKIIALCIRGDMAAIQAMNNGETAQDLLRRIEAIRPRSTLWRGGSG